MQGMRYLLVCFCLLVGIVKLTPAQTGSTNPEVDAEDRQVLHQRATEFRQELDSRGLLVSNEAWQEYVDSVGGALVTHLPEGPGTWNVRFYLIRSYIVNAFALPDTSVYITIGLLSRLENEVQLAQALSHEISHILHDHPFKAYQNSRDKTARTQILDVVLLGTSIAFIPLMATLANYSREQEEEADLTALRLMSDAGYNLENAYNFFDVLSESKTTESVKNSIYSSHPTNSQRREYVTARIASGEIPLLPDGRIGKERYLACRKQIALENIHLKLLGFQYELARDVITRELELAGESPWLHYYMGESWRLSAKDPRGAAVEFGELHGKEVDDELLRQFRYRKRKYLLRADEEYHKALALDSTFVLAYRGLGLVAYEQGKMSSALEALSTYESFADHIKDRRYVEYLIKKAGEL